MVEMRQHFVVLHGDDGGRDDPVGGHANVGLGVESGLLFWGLFLLLIWLLQLD